MTICTHLFCAYVKRDVITWHIAVAQSRLAENVSKSLQARSRLVMKMRLYETKSYPSAEISLVDERNLGKMFSLYEHNFTPHSGKLSVVSVTFNLYLTK